MKRNRSNSDSNDETFESAALDELSHKDTLSIEPEAEANIISTESKVGTETQVF